MRGYNGKVTKTNMTNEFSFEFNASGDFVSQLDLAAKNLYKLLREKSQKKEEEQDLLGGIETYFISCLMADDKIIWKHVSGPILAETQDMLREFSIAVFGECG